MKRRIVSAPRISTYFLRFFTACVCLALLAGSGVTPAAAAANPLAVGKINPTDKDPVILSEVYPGPTLDPIAPQTVMEDSVDNTVELTGIDVGASDDDLNLSVIASSSDHSLLPDPTVTYTSPDATGSLSFSPVQNANGKVDVTVTVLNNGGSAAGGDDGVPQTFQVTITPVNDPPTISTFTKTGTRGKSLAFTAQDFIDAYSDVESDPLAGIEIVSLPATGKLALDGIIVSANTAVPAAQLGKLSFIPSSGWCGSTDFSWTANDGQVDSTMPAEVHLYYPYSSLQTFIPFVMKSRPSLITEDFEGDFPGAWQLLSYTNNSYPGFDVTDLVSWGKRDCHAASGKYGGWAVGGGSLGGSWSCTEGYPDSITTWMTYGPIDLSQVKDGWMSMKIWTNVEYNYDRVGWGVSLDDDMFYGRTTTGYGDAWLNDAIDLKNIYVLGDVTGHSQVWIGIWFDSDSYYAPEQGGAAVDDFSLNTCTSGLCTDKPVVTGMSQLPDTLQMMPISMEMHKAGLMPVSLADAKMLNDPTLAWLKKTLKP